jgi:hypothetical protein
MQKVSGALINTRGEKLDSECTYDGTIDFL